MLLLITGCSCDTMPIPWAMNSPFWPNELLLMTSTPASCRSLHTAPGLTNLLTLSCASKQAEYRSWASCAGCPRQPILQMSAR